MRSVVALIWLCWLSSYPLQADEQIAVGQWQWSVAAGYGYMENPRAKAKPVITYLLPSVQYYGERFYLDNFTLGYSLYEGQHWLLDVQSRLNEDGFFFQLDGLDHLLATDLFANRPIKGEHPGLKQPDYSNINRHISYLGGFNISWVTDSSEISLGYFQDISGVHHGAETQLRLRQRYPLQWGVAGIELGVTYKDNKLVRYYYQLTRSEMANYKVRQVVGNSVNSHVRLVLNAPLTKRWFLTGLVEYNLLGSGIHRSFLIDKTNYWSVFAGVGYAF